MSNIKCEKLIATHFFRNGILGGPKEINFDYMLSDQEKINIDIEQLVVRKITISSDKDINTKDLYATYINLEKLLMLFDGRFIPLEDLKFENSTTNTDEELLSIAQDKKDQRLSYYKTVDFCNTTDLKLLDFESFLDEHILKEWTALLDEMDIMFQIFLYFTADNHIPVDCRCAFFIEAAESMVELLNHRKNLFPKLTPGKKGTSLRMCLEKMIEEYGQDIFNKEISQPNTKFWDFLIASRVRIMHIKLNQPKTYFNGAESLLYTTKFLLLYRHILFDLLGIDESKYKTELIGIVDRWDNHDNILSQFLSKI